MYCINQYRNIDGIIQQMLVHRFLRGLLSKWATGHGFASSQVSTSKMAELIKQAHTIQFLVTALLELSKFWPRVHDYNMSMTDANGKFVVLLEGSQRFSSFV